MSFVKFLPETVVKRLQNSWLEYRKIGLYYADLYNETPVMKEALNRLPPQVLVERDRRKAIAFDCNVKKIYLPENLWSDLEKDKIYTDQVEGVMQQVEKEFEIRRQFRE
ncbi:cytochrome bd ubiquinol oxidase [Heterostelium album PN500]|uniref:Cytochrome bd ubiquinol oxidase n=1 Tax=Heterostelium pallidum (strain ATCC 26659 / Pp 5 / PN500) TaxID=670386 RepID=D3BBJ3_HETP5|nr:cytochrome bd ubiquinol oxidase [Heterostelium album PN500]EFA81026.1 cytochrome bd ubiquinol oxidase [Heterostelium album PN500]|eukprot:XP_020433144.1 cytochrome bd ubiquinol oxidase [Heterostelium album PN500]